MYNDIIYLFQNIIDKSINRGGLPNDLLTSLQAARNSVKS